MPRKDATARERAFGAAVGLAVARSRHARGLSGPDLARLSDISVDTIRSLETGRVASPGLYAVARLSIALEVSLESLAAEGIGAATASAASDATSAAHDASPGADRKADQQ